MTVGALPAPTLAEIAPAGQYLALRIRLASPIAVVNDLPCTWVEHYTCMGFLLDDPVMCWAYTQEGVTRWSEIRMPDPKGVLAAAREHGLSFGVCVSLLDRSLQGGRSLGLFLRSDREFTDMEMVLLQLHVNACHEALTLPRELTPCELDVLRLMKAGHRFKQISYELGITENTVKQRLCNIRRKLGARTSFEAISRAEMFRLI